MNHYISLLRGINVSGQKKIKMEDLRTLYASLGFENVQSYIQSGNVLFSSTEKSIPSMTKKILDAIEKKYGFEVKLFITDRKAIRKVLKENPFMKMESPDTSKLYFTFLSQKPAPVLIKSLKEYKDPQDEFIIDKQTIYLNVPSGAGRTKLTNNFFERKLKVDATTRNWRTVNKLVEMAE